MNATPPTMTDTSAPAAAPTSGQVATIDTNRPGVPMSRLIAVELRKLVNTRAGLWLVLAIGLVSLLIMTAMLIWAEDRDLVFGNIFGLMNIPTGFLLPVLAILLVTSEWGQRTGLVTFTLEPRRSRVVVAKLATALVAAVGAMLTALGFGALGNLLAGECVVVLNPDAVSSIVRLRKSSMQLASKMRFVSAQLVALLSDELWLRNAQHSNAMAQRLEASVRDIPGVQVMRPVQANAVFATLPADVTHRLQQTYPFYTWDESTGEVRWMASFDTTENDIDDFAAAIAREMSRQS